MGVNLFVTEKSHGTILSTGHAESQRSNPTDEKIKTTLANIPVKESDHEGEKKVFYDGSKKRKGCSSSKKMNKVRRLTLEKTEEKKENEEKPLTFTIANREIQLPFSYKERLARDSDFFRGLFTHPMQEKITGKYKIEDIEFDDFQRLINLWSGDSTVNVQEACDLLEVGSRLGLGESLAKILIPTIKSWSPSDAVDIETACALSLASPFFASLPSLTSELELFLVKAYLAANDEAQTLLGRIQALDLQNLNLSESSVDDQKLENLISVCPNLATLVLQRTLITDRSAEQIAKLSKLTTLNVSECRFLTDAAMEPLAQLPNLANLDVSYCWLTDAGLERMAKFPNLTSLNLMGNEQLSDAGVKSVYKLSKLSALNLSGRLRGGLEGIATQLPNLTSLQLRSCQLTDADMQWIAKLTHLTSLDISGCGQVTDAGFKEIAELFQLTKLNARGCDQMTDAGIEFIADKLTGLTELDLAGCKKLTDVAAEHISRFFNLEGLCFISCDKLTDVGLEMIASLTKLTRLDVSGCGQLTTNSMPHMIKLTNLTALGMNSCFKLVTDKAMELIPKLCHLRVLNINNCNLLTDTGLKYITELSNLTSLNIGGCNSLTDDGYASIANLHNLIYLDLQWSGNLRKGSMQLVAENCRQLTSLNLIGCNALIEDLSEVAPFLPNLTALNLNGLTQFFPTENGAVASSLTEKSLIQIVTHLPKLMHLEIRECPILTDSVIKQIAPLLPDLKSLNISWCQYLTDEGMRELTVCRNLRELNISSCRKITDAFVEHIIQLPRLIIIQLNLDFFYTPITQTAIQKMIARGIRVRKIGINH